MAERSYTLDAENGAVGKNCTYCGERLESGDVILECPRCRSLHHYDCWLEYGGCAKRGCPEVAESASTRRPQDEEHRRRVTPHEIGVAVGVALVLLLLGFVLFNHFTDEPAAGKNAIRVMLPYSLEDYEALVTLKEEFEAEHPDAHVYLETVPITGYREKLVILLAAKDLPDIFACWPKDVPLLAEHGVLLDLEPYLTGTAWAEDINPLYWEDVTVDGRRVALPHRVHPYYIGVYSLSKHSDLAWEFAERIVLEIPQRLPEDYKSPFLEEVGAAPPWF